MSTDIDDFLEHFGVKGMKWGVKTSGSGGSGGGSGDAVPVKKLSRREVKAINKKGQFDYDSKKTAEVYNEAKSKGENVLVKTRTAGDFVDTVMTGKQFADHVEAGGALNLASTRVFARQTKAGEQFVMNSFETEVYIPIKRK